MRRSFPKLVTSGWSKVVFEAGRRWNDLEAWRYDRRYGVHTRGKASMTQMGIDGDIAEHGTGFQSVNEQNLRTVLDEMRFDPECGFVDIGCGKGKALAVASSYGFTPLVGVEVVDELCVDARANLDKLGLSDRTEIHCINGLDYTFGGERVVFLNNPFDHQFLTSMIDRLSDDTANLTKPTWLLYGNPEWHDILDNHEGWDHVRRFHFRGPGRDIAVYRRGATTT